tara:strand:+ start:451 stop:1410 length:960 start_codon:yes stop_codon:yes gene_type:complete
MNKDSKIFLAGSTGMVGSAILRELKKSSFTNIITPDSKQLNLLNQLEVEKFFEDTKPDYIFCAAAKVGGIYANDKFSADFIYENIQIQNNLIHSSMKNNIKKFLFLGSSCIYPRESKQPIKEEYLLTNSLEETNEAYAIAKISGIKMLEHYQKCYGLKSVSLMPCNLYGNNDNYDLNTSHVFPALIRKFVDAKINNSPFVEVWGTGQVFREFMHVNDIARASIYFMENEFKTNLINIGWGKEISIIDLVELIKKSTKYSGNISWDKSKKDGTVNKKLDVEKMKTSGFKPVISLEEGINLTIESFCQEYYNKSFQSLINN